MLDVMNLFLVTVLVKKLLVVASLHESGLLIFVKFLQNGSHVIRYFYYCVKTPVNFSVEFVFKQPSLMM